MVYYRTEYAPQMSIDSIMEAIFRQFFPNEKYQQFHPQLLLDFVKAYPNPVCIMFDKVDHLASIQLKKNQQPTH